jgi:3-hydroxybutyryl-CoA dehydrogenase
MKIETIGVVGAGQMGSGIAQVAAQAGFAVVMLDRESDWVQRGLQNVERSLGRLVSRGTLSQEQSAQARARIVGSVNLADLAGAQLVIEAIVEEEGAKRQLFQQLDRLLEPRAILASNTSSIPITALAASTQRPEQFIGMHFMNPVPVMELLEVIRGQLTSDQTTQTVLELGRAMGKTPVEVNDYPGFVSNRILLPMLNEAIQCVMEGVGTPQAIDQVMKLGMNHPMGPLTLADFIGLDTCLSIMEVLQRGLGDDKYRPSPLLRRMVQAGLLGRKVGRGFYTYDARGQKID